MGTALLFWIVGAIALAFGFGAVINHCKSKDNRRSDWFERQTEDRDNER